MDLYNEKGEKVDNVLTQEEVDAKIQEEKQKVLDETEIKHQEEVDVFLKEKEQLETEKIELEAKLAGESDKEKNFGKLRKIAEEKDKKLDELNKKIEELSGTFTKKIEEVSTKALEDVKEDMLTRLDKNTRDKVEFYYKSFAGVPTTKEELKQRITNAIILVAGGKKINPLSGEAISSVGGIGNIFDGKIEGKLDNTEAKDVGKKLGLSDKDLANL